MDGSDGAPPGGLLALALRVVEPEGPRVLERVRGGEGGRGGVVGDLALLPVVVLRSVRGAAPGARGGRPRVDLVGHGGGGGWDECESCDAASPREGRFGLATLGSAVLPWVGIRRKEGNKRVGLVSAGPGECLLWLG